MKGSHFVRRIALSINLYNFTKSYKYLKSVENLEDRIVLALTESEGVEDKVKRVEKINFYASVGRGITAWHSLENSLVLITAIILRCDTKQVGILLYHNMNFGGWIGSITDLMKVDDRCEPFKKDWTKISHKLRELKDIRDRLAHNTSSLEAERLGTKLQLIPGKLDFRQKSQTHKPLSEGEIDLFTENVYKLAEQAMRLTQSLYAALISPNVPLLEKAPSQEDGPDPEDKPQALR